MNHRTDTQLQEYTTEQVSLLGLYRLIVGALLLAILMTGVMIVIQTQKRHQTYQELVRLKQAMTELQIEESRLLIEQQTFSATPQVAQRAVGELAMYYPSAKEQIMGEPVSMDNDTSIKQLSGGLHE